MDTEIRKLFRKMRQAGLGYEETSKALMEIFTLEELEIILTATMSAAFSQMNIITGDPAKRAIDRHNNDAKETGNRRLRKQQIAGMQRIFHSSNRVMQDSEPDITEMPTNLIKQLRQFISDKYNSLAIISQKQYGNQAPLILYGLREESDKEYKGRLARKRKKEAEKTEKETQQKAKELAMYEKLKEKYG